MTRPYAPWLPAHFDAAVAVLRRTLPGGVVRALPAIAAAMGRPSLNSDALTSAFRRAGLGAPSDYCIGGSRNSWPGAVDDIPIDVSDFGDTLAPLSSLADDDDEPATEPQRRSTAPSPAPVADRLYVDRVPEPERLARPSDNGLDMWIVLSDAHIPFEDRAAYDLVYSVCRRFRPHGVASVGDYADMLSVSTHPKSPLEMRWQLEDEMERVRARRAELDALDCDRRVITLGNHETRGQRLATAQLMSLYKTLDPDHIIEFSKHGWEVKPYQEEIKIGKVHLVHDIGYCGVNAVRANALAFQASVMTGHTHSAECRYFGNVLGENHVSMSIGWLGDRRAARYMPDAKKRANWQHAFGVMYVERATQNTHAFVVPIVDGRCVVGGELFEACASSEAA